MKSPIGARHIRHGGPPKTNTLASGGILQESAGGHTGGATALRCRLELSDLSSAGLAQPGWPVNSLDRVVHSYSAIGFD